MSFLIIDHTPSEWMRIFIIAGPAGALGFFASMISALNGRSANIADHFGEAAAVAFFAGLIVSAVITYFRPRKSD
jgi:hypothetical protein